MYRKCFSQHRAFFREHLKVEFLYCTTVQKF